MAGPEAEALRREEDSDDEEVLVQRMRDRIGHQHATVQGNPSSAPPGAGRNHSPPPDQPASSEGEFASDFQAMEAAQFQARLSAEAKVQAAELDATSDASDGPVDPSEDPSDTSPESREVRVAKRTVRPPDVHPSTDFNPVSGHSKHAVFGTSGRWGGGVADGAKQASQPNKTFGHADVSSIQEVSGVDAWLSKRAGEPGSSPIPEESADGRRAEPPSALTVGRQPSPERRKKEIYTPEPMERLPSERKVFAASFSTTPRGDVHAAQKIARHGSVHQHTAQEEEEMFQHDSGGWSNVRWSADVSKMLGKDTHSRTQHRDLYGQTEEDKELIRQQIERTRLLAEEEERIRNTPSSVTNPRWKHSINAVPVPAPKPAPKRPPKVQTSPRPAVGRKEGGPSSPFLASARDDLYSHRTTGSPRPGQLHSSDLNETLPLRSETETDNDGDNAGGENAGDDARGVGWMLNHEIRPFEGDSEVVKVAKQRWGAQLLGSGGAKASQAEESALGYSPKASRDDGDSQCHTKSKPDGQIQAVRWVQEERDDRFDRSSVHHPDHYKRLLYGTTYDSQMRVAQNLHSETHKSKGSHVAHMVVRPNERFPHDTAIARSQSVCCVDRIATGRPRGGTASLLGDRSAGGRAVRATSTCASAAATSRSSNGWAVPRRRPSSRSTSRGIRTARAATSRGSTSRSRSPR